MKNEFLKLTAYTLLMVSTVYTSSAASFAVTDSVEIMQSKSDKQIPFTIARRYFVKNNVKGINSIRIDTQAEFDKIFGPAAAMGSLPTNINFKNQTVIAVITGKSEYTTDLVPVSLIKKKNGEIHFTYKKKTGKEKRTWTADASLALIVDKNVAGNGKLIETEIR